ncbi:MAG: chemotaxis protein CheY [Pseudomonadota bacterium]|jgi:tetratricopeptide (TPR) repeat protein
MGNNQLLKTLFTGKSSPVLVIHPSKGVNGQIVTCLKDAGFTNVVPTGDINEATTVLREMASSGQFPCWIITTLFTQEKTNALQLGQLVATTPQLTGVFWSAIVSNEEYFTLPLAFDNGLLSWHLSSSFSQGVTIAEEIRAVMEAAARFDYSQDFVSLAWARKYLRATDSYEALLHLTASIVELRPEDPELLLDYADALALNMDADGARRYAMRAVWADKRLASRLGEIAERDRTRVFSDDDIAALASSNESLLSSFGIARGVIVDPDTAVRNHLRKACLTLGIKEIQEFDDGEAAWDFLKGNHAGTIVISEWKLPKLSGMALLQRIHQEGWQDTLVIISSAQLGPQDKGLMEELGSAVLIQKPLSLESLENNIRLAVKEENLPSTFRGLMRKVRSMLRKGDTEGAKTLWEAAAQKMLIPGAQRKLMTAEILLAEAKLEEAYGAAQEASAMGAKGTYFYNLLGKITFALGDFDSSAEWLEKANKEVPINLHRLTNLAEVELHRGDLEKATERTSEAASIDATNPKVIETQAMVALEKGNPDEARAMMDQLNDLMNIVAHLNNRAVVMAWKGDPDKGIELYREALAANPDKDAGSDGKGSFAPFVTYNLALALARKGDLDAAINAVSSIDKDAAEKLGERLMAKISGFQQRAREAQKSGKKLEIETPKTSDIARNRLLKLKKTKAPAPGQLVKSLKSLGTVDYRALKMVEKKLRFDLKK